MKESNIQNLLMVELSKYGVCFRTNSGMAKAVNGVGWIKLLPEGFSDLLFIGAGGYTAFIECKTLTGKLRESQKRFESMVRGLGFDYYVVRSADEIPEKIRFLNYT